MTYLDSGRVLPAGILERFVLYVHRELNQRTNLRLQIWYPVDIRNRLYRLDYEKRVVVEPSNGLYTVRLLFGVL